MTRRHDRARLRAVQAVLVFPRSLLAMTREPMPTPRHARYDSRSDAR